VAFNVNIDTSGITVAGLRQARQLTVATLVRDFVVYVPKSARGTRAPVVFMLHGTSGDGPQFYNISGWRQKADAEGLITVFPSALTHCFYEDENRNGIFEEPSPPTAEGPTFEKKVTTKWAHGALGVASEMPLCTGAQIDALDNDAKEALVRHPLADDVAFFDAMLDFLAANYPIDAKRVHVSGFSNGGQMAARLAMERSQRFAAATSNAGPLQVSSVATRPISMIYAVGSMDDRYLPDPACLTVVPRAPSCITELPMDATILQSAAIQGQIDGYLNALRLANTYTFSEGWGECDATGSCTVRATQAQCVNAADCRKLAKFAYTTSTVGANNQFHFILIESATHQYPNGTNHELIMADYFWEDFFKNLALP
jgi:polyhydroxybutyrate depolymerase